MIQPDTESSECKEKEQESDEPERHESMMSDVAVVTQRIHWRAMLGMPS